MPRNGSGTYTPPVTSWNPAVTGQPISSTDWNTTLADLAQGLTDSVDPDGQTPMTGNLNMNSHSLLAVDQVLIESPGTATSPGYSFAGDANTGMYQTAANVIAWSINGVLQARLNTNGFFLEVGQFRSISGNVSLPVYSFVDDVDSGFYYNVANTEVRVAVAGGNVMSWSATRPIINAITNDLSATPLGRLSQGVYQITSSRRIKANIRDHEPDVAKFLQYRIRDYERKTDDGFEPGRTYTGVVVEELFDTHPDRVNFSDDGLPESPDSGAMIAECIAVIQRLLARVEALENA